ncbi:MAG: hypothetical protein COB14_00915 [Alphaproteobacteria bacterium]|nr:MAG: hypothetical protein COB14_00915 [Alphaproteobacteria bacterium]
MDDDLIKFHIHYDVNDHFISMSDFLTASKSAERIINDLNVQFLGGDLKYKLVIVPPDDGTFLKTIGILAFTVIASNVVVPIVQDYALGAFEELAQNAPSHYGQQHMKALKDLTTGFFSKEVEELDRIIPHNLNLDRAFKAKSDFYISCQKSELINGIGFDTTKVFPIRHSDFKQHISKDRTRAVESDFYVYDAVLVSPVTIDKDIKWVLEDRVTKTKISAYMHV